MWPTHMTPPWTNMLLIGVLSLLALRHCQAANLFKDPGFESGNPKANWDCPSCKIDLSSDHRGGHHSIQITYRAANWAGPEQDASVRTDGYYYLQAYIKQQNNLPSQLFQQYSLLLSIQKNNGAYDYLTVATNKFVYSGSGWFLLSCYFKFDHSDHKRVVIRVNGPEPGINFLVDDMSITEIAEDTHWKAEADARIDNLRKSNIHFNVHVPPHVSTADLEIKVDLVKHSFPFGSQTSWQMMTEHPEYNHLFYYMFNWATENNFYWEWSPPPTHNPDYSKAMHLIDNLHQRGVPVRGHNILWGANTKYVPNWVQSRDAAGVKQAVEERLQYIVKDTKGKIEHWDVNNELCHGQWFEEKTGDPDYTKKVFSRMHHLDPHAKLFLNDYSVVSSSDTTSAYVNQALSFKAANVGLYGLGIQCHFGDNVRPDPTLVKKRLDQMGSAGLPLWVTELDIVVNDPNTRADYYDLLLRLLFSHPAVEGIILWGFWEKDQWRGKDAAIVDANFQLNAAGKRYVDLLYKEWSTHASHTVSSGNKFSLRGFHGDYQVLVKYHGNTVMKQTFHLDKHDKTVNINIPNTMHPLNPPTIWTPNTVQHHSTQLSHIKETTLGSGKSMDSNNLECMNRYSGFSQVGDDKMTETSCPAGWLMTGCTSKIKNARDTRDGERMELEGGVVKCKAYDAYDASSPTQAVARCCKLTGLSCEYRKSGPSQAVRDQRIETRCLSNKYAMGCAAHNYLKDQDGTFPTAHSCVAQNKDSHANVESFAACCFAPRLTCKVKVSGESGDKIGDTSSVRCDSGWKMMGCSAYSQDSKLSGTVIEDNPERCTATNGAQRTYQEMGAVAYATCCKVN